MNVEKMIWTEKYRPKTIDQYVFPEDFSDIEIELLKSIVMKNI
jgi:hypothetical protein